MVGRFIHRLALHYRWVALAAALAMLGGVALSGLGTSTASAQMYYYTYPTYSYYSPYYYTYPSYSDYYTYNPYSYYYGYNGYNPYTYSYTYPSYNNAFAYYYGNPCAAWGYVC